MECRIPFQSQYVALIGVCLAVIVWFILKKNQSETKWLGFSVFLLIAALAPQLYTTAIHGAGSTNHIEPSYLIIATIGLYLKIYSLSCEGDVDTSANRWLLTGTYIPALFHLIWLIMMAEFNTPIEGMTYRCHEEGHIRQNQTIAFWSSIALSILLVGLVANTIYYQVHA